MKSLQLHSICRGGDLGSHTTAKKKNAKGLTKQLHDLMIMESFEDGGEEHHQVEANIVDQISNLVEKWRKHQPTKDQAVEALKEVINNASRQVHGDESTKEIKIRYLSMGHPKEVNHCKENWPRNMLKELV